MKTKEEKKMVLKLTETECIKLEKELETLTMALQHLRNNRENNNLDNDWYIVHEESQGVQEKLIIAEIDKVRRILSSAVRVDTREMEDNVVNLNDVVELNVIFDEEDQERMVVRLETVRKTNSPDDIDVISIESPLGKAIYKQKVGDMISYKVNNSLLQVEILGKVNQDVSEVGAKKSK